MRSFDVLVKDAENTQGGGQNDHFKQFSKPWLAWVPKLLRAVKEPTRLSEPISLRLSSSSPGVISVSLVYLIAVSGDPSKEDEKSKLKSQISLESICFLIGKIK